MVPNSLTAPPVLALLDRLFQAAEGDDARRAGHGYLSIAFPESDGLEISCRA
jgi:hypothetical protein